MQDIRRQIGIALRWLPLIVVAALVAGLLAFTWASGQPKVYEATGRLRVDPGPNYTLADLAAAESAAITYADLATREPILEVVIDQLGLDETTRSLSERIEVSVAEDTPELVIAARAGTPSDASDLVTAVGRQTTRWVRDELMTANVAKATEALKKNENLLRQLEQRLNALLRKPNKRFGERTELIALSAQIASLRRDIEAQRAGSKSSVRNLLQWFVEPQEPRATIEPRPLYWTLLALVVGGMAAIALAFVIEYIRTLNKVRDERDLQNLPGLPGLGAVIEAGQNGRNGDWERSVMLHYPRGDEAEAYRSLIAKIGFFGGEARSLMVTSARPSDAKSVVAVNIALAYAEAGRNVILVDADYRSPRVHSFLGVSNDRGLTTILADANVPLGWATLPTSHPRLGLMPSGPLPRETSEPLGSRQLNALLRRLLHAADLVVFDSPPVAGHLDAAVLAEQLSSSLLVVSKDDPEDETEEAATALQSASADFVGAVLYRKVRRARRRGRAGVVPAPKGWGPGWSMLHDSTPQLPAVASSRPYAHEAVAGTEAAAQPEAPGRSVPPMPRPAQPPNRPAPRPAPPGQPGRSSQPLPPVPSTPQATPYRPVTPAPGGFAPPPHQRNGNGGAPPPQATGPYSVPFRQPNGREGAGDPKMGRPTEPVSPGSRTE